MSQEKEGIRHRIKHIFTHHPLLKIIALLLAILVWFYVSGETR